jgi:hypothetical protein
MIPVILAFMFGGLLGAGIMAVCSVSGQQSRLEEKNPPFNLETHSRLSQSEQEAFWGNE